MTVLIGNDILKKNCSSWAIFIPWRKNGIFWR